MKILSWNCRGLGNPRTVRDLCRLVKEKRPTMVFLMETILKKKKMERIRCKMGFDNMLVVDCIGKSGGLALLWKIDEGVEIQNYSCRHINAIVRSKPDGGSWKFTGFYGHPDASKRNEAWALLRHLAPMDPEPWMCVGDFNEILFSSEKWGGKNRSRGLMKDFHDTLSECNLVDLGFRGPKFTWNNGRDGDAFVQERLDRVVANEGWSVQFPKADILVEGALSSDHLPIIVTLQEEPRPRCSFRNFKHEAAWVLDGSYREVIKAAWRVKPSRAEPWSGLGMNLNNCKEELKKWQAKKKGPENQIKNLCKQVTLLQATEGPRDIAEISELKKKAQTLLEQEEIQWKQRAKVEWLQNGDRNTKFYHACANQRRTSNKIREVCDLAGNRMETQEDIGRAFVDYFSDLFSTGQPDHMEECLETVDRRISTETNDRLLRPFTAAEVELAIHQMAPLKAPGPDGFNACFYQKNWELIGGEVCNAVISTLNLGVINKEINSTYIALIPKSKNPICVTDYRPISLCNVIYKLISKVLANRLKEVLPTIISPYQSAFIPGRLITDNILAAYETLHTMHSRMYGKKGFMAVKVDMSKAYDRVE
jgi:exonuclease III